MYSNLDVLWSLIMMQAIFRVHALTFLLSDGARRGQRSCDLCTVAQSSFSLEEQARRPGRRGGAGIREELQRVSSVRRELIEQGPR